MQMSGAMDAMGIESRDDFGVALSMMEYAFRGAGEIYTGNCVAVICLFLWLILYGREINFPSVLVETGRKYAFLIYLLHPAMSDLLKNVQKVWESATVRFIFGCVRFWYIC